MATDIVDCARGWIGTPYQHQASLKGVGCDCLGLLRGVWRELYGAEPEAVPPYASDWAEGEGAETLRDGLRATWRPCPVMRSCPAMWCCCACTGAGPPDIARSLARGTVC